MFKIRNFSFFSKALKVFRKNSSLTFNFDDGSFSHNLDGQRQQVKNDDQLSQRDLLFLRP